MPNSATFDDVYLGDPNINAVVRDGAVPTLAGVPLVNIHDVAYGLPVVEGESFGAGQLVVPLSILGDTAEDAEAKRGALMKLLTRPGKRRFYFDNFEKNVAFNAKLVGASPSPMSGPLLEFDVTFMTDPFRLGRSQESLDYVIDSSPKTVFVTSAATPAPGSAFAHPRWILRNVSGSPDTGVVVIKNVTTNELASWTGTIADDDYLIFDATQLETVQKGSDPDNANDAMSGFTAGGVLPRLEGGVINQITITGLPDAELTVEFYPESF